MYPINFYKVVGSQVVTSHAANLMKLEYTIAAGATGGYLQLHDSLDVPASGAVPLKSWTYVAEEVQYKEFKNGELHVSTGLVLVLSSTKGTYTALADTIAIASFELFEADETVTVVTDVDIDAQTVWASGGTGRRLRKINVTFGSSASPCWLLAFGKAPTNGDVPALVIGSGESESVEFDFGKSGLAIFQTTNVNTFNNGCYLAVSSTANILTATAGSDNSIRSEYVS